MAEAGADVVVANRDAESGQEAAEWAAAGVRVNNICPGYVIDGGYTVR
jgi:NAD(P)-dependent dehydrogenase (short-subunit alcohol dehydrogenase family)